MRDTMPPEMENLTPEDIEKLIGDRGERAYDEMAKQLPDVFCDVRPEPFLSIYNAAFMVGFRNAEAIYRARLLSLAIDEEDDGGQSR